MAPFSSHGNQRVLITVHDHDISPRFDYTLEVLIVEKDGEGQIVDKKNLLLSEPSAEEICNLVQTENVQAVICGGIEADYYQYLTWKKVLVFDNIMGPVSRVLEAWTEGVLKEDTIFRD
ncbi:NifB/NifX family molybdenum-iron cluster-binding protein [Desulfonatronovibrio hydrogenovorans]|uniref:NifB/NifX family molybdenum-iron cluster-binding protein n=1 Tax=Desulfonatronovibrio hydrogenovorans TaxID=53245 RepID=UPI00049083DA|nr:NifB/NifX family molybdenum-iron cluster-binding protein [Desulfonatronovibrio hydrogenovorans]